MRIEHYSEAKLKKELTDIIGQRLDLSKYKVFFFGSRVTGRGNDRSDIDVGIDGPAAIPWQIMSEIREKLYNLPTLYKIDVVDFYDASPKFREVAIENIEFLQR